MSMPGGRSRHLPARVAGVVGAVVSTAGLVWMSQVPVAPRTNDTAILRLAWSARPERLETCQPQSGEAQALLPAHMRQALICEGRAATYRLEVRRNGVSLAEEVVTGGGLRHDRPLFVSREFVVPPGPSAIVVRFSRIEPAPAADRQREETGERESTLERRDEAQRERARGMAAPPLLLLDESLTFAPRTVTLVTYDDDRRALVVKTAP